MAVYFHRITALALPANLLCMPFIGAVMVSAVIAFLGAIIHPTVAMLPCAATAALLHSIQYVITHISRIGVA